ncbi:GumC family protein [Aestuariivirga sp.]|uniref:GumC family protein n=1 Tax=Aestuariivirga sp. TaxID=2650926 RepID=UPI00391A708E
MSRTGLHGSSSMPPAIEVTDVFRNMLRRRLLVFGCGLLAMAAGLAIVTLSAPVYTALSQVLIQDQETRFDRVQAQDGDGGGAVDDRVVASQINVMRSDDLGRRVVAALALEEKEGFGKLPERLSPASRLKVALGFAADPSRKTPAQRALEAFGASLNVYQFPQSNVIGIEVQAADPRTAASIANTLADTYVTWTREAQVQPTERARQWLSDQIELLRRKLAQTEQEVETFRAAAGLLKGQGARLGEQEISELNSQITVARAASLEARARAEALRAMLEQRGAIDEATDVLNSPAVQRLKEQRSDATRRASELSVTYLPNHPKMIAVRNEIAGIDRQIRAEAQNIAASLDEQVQVAEARQLSLEQRLDSLKREETDANLDDVKLKALEREAAADRALLEAMLSRYAEASARQDLTAQPGMGVVIQKASPPAVPSFPQPGPMVLLMTLAGFTLGICLAFALELMAAATRQPPRADLAGGTGAEPVLFREPERAAAAHVPGRQPPASFPRLPAEAALEGVFELPEVAAPAGLAAAWAEDLRRDAGVGRLGVMPLGSAGRESAVAALAIARQLTRSARRVILVDLSAEDDVIGELCGAAAARGISDLVTGAADFTGVIRRDAKSSLHLLSHGADHSPRARTLLFERLEGVFSSLTKTYEHVVVHLGPATEESPYALTVCEAVLLIAAPERAREAEAVVATLREGGVIAADPVIVGAPPRALKGAGTATAAAAAQPGTERVSA